MFYSQKFKYIHVIIYLSSLICVLHRFSQYLLLSSELFSFTLFFFFLIFNFHTFFFLSFIEHYIKFPVFVTRVTSFGSVTPRPNDLRAPDTKYPSDLIAQVTRPSIFYSFTYSLLLCHVQCQYLLGSL